MTAQILLSQTVLWDKFNLFQLRLSLNNTGMIGEEKMSEIRIKSLLLGLVQNNCYIVYDEETKRGAIIDPGDCAEQIIAFSSIFSNVSLRSISACLAIAAVSSLIL